MDRTGTPSLLPIFRSQQQAEILHFILSDPTQELALTEISERTGVPYASTHREIERAEQAGLVTSRKVGRTRILKANVDSPYFAGLADLLLKAFGPAAVLTEVLLGLDGIRQAFLYGSWAAGYTGQMLERPVGDIDLLVLGEPDRDALYRAVSSVEQRLGREVQVTLRKADWLKNGTGAFHSNVAARPMVELLLKPTDTAQATPTQEGA